MLIELIFALGGTAAVEQQGQDLRLCIRWKEVNHVEAHADGFARQHGMRVFKADFVEGLDAELSQHLVTHRLLHGVAHMPDNVFTDHLCDALRVDVHQGEEALNRTNYKDRICVRVFG